MEVVQEFGAYESYCVCACVCVPNHYQSTNKSITIQVGNTIHAHTNLHTLPKNVIAVAAAAAAGAGAAAMEKVALVWQWQK
jgi:hypothetical protein